MDNCKKEVDSINSVDFFHQRRFVILDYSIKTFEFTVKINYDKGEFGHLISEYVSEMIKAI